MVLIRPFRSDTDIDGVKNVWVEIGWLESSDDSAGIGWTFADGQGLVAELDGRVEVSANGVAGFIQHRTDRVPLWGITSVTTSRLARRQNIASRLTAEVVRLGREQGAHVAILGVFDTGYYDRLGFGTGSYELSTTFDPATLTVPPLDRTPRRLTGSDIEEISAALWNRMPTHGQCYLDYPGEVRADFEWDSKKIAFGFDTDGTLTHLLHGRKHDDRGGLVIHDLVYQNREQLLELLSLIAGFADQSTNVRLLMDPAVIQLNDLLDRPVRHSRVTRTAETPLRTDALPWWQARLLRVPETLSLLTAPDTVEFELAVTDPIGSHLPADSAASRWSGEQGSYRVTIGPASNCEVCDPGASGLPVIEASIGALSRWWLGVTSASSLHTTDVFDGPPDLLETLDAAVWVPAPHVNLPF